LSNVIFDVNKWNLSGGRPDHPVADFIQRISDALKGGQNMSPKVTVARVEFDVGWGQDLSVLVSYSCPKCKTPNQANLSDYQKGDKIPCFSCGMLIFDMSHADFRPIRESFENLKRIFSGFKK
jgi:DNA-directed RNA polymerase subunit RPC12/RpoP